MQQQQQHSHSHAWLGSPATGPATCPPHRRQSSAPPASPARWPAARPRSDRITRCEASAPQPRLSAYTADQTRPGAPPGREERTGGKHWILSVISTGYILARERTAGPLLEQCGAVLGVPVAGSNILWCSVCWSVTDSSFTGWRERLAACRWQWWRPPAKVRRGQRPTPEAHTVTALVPFISTVID